MAFSSIIHRPYTPNRRAGIHYPRKSKPEPVIRARRLSKKRSALCSGQLHDPDLLILLNDVGRMLRTEADRRAKAHGMSRAQWVILVRLDRQPGLSQKELAELLEVEPITVARLADRLEARDLLERRPDPSDRRVWRLHLLAAAQPVLDELVSHRDDLIALLTARLDPQTIETVTAALLQMRSTLSRRPELEVVA